MLDIITRLFDNAAFVCIHVVGRFSKNFLEVRAMRSWGDDNSTVHGILIVSVM